MKLVEIYGNLFKWIFITVWMIWSSSEEFLTNHIDMNELSLFDPHWVHTKIMFRKGHNKSDKHHHRRTLIH